MHFSIQNITGQNISEAKLYFSNIFELKNESLVARFFIAKHLEKTLKRDLLQTERVLLENFSNGICGIILDGKKYYFSLSHKDNTIFVGVQNKKLGVDIEVIKKREESLLNIYSKNEYRLLGGKAWKNFYIIWTIKEAFIKYKQLTLDSMQDIEITNIQDRKNIISGFQFDLDAEITYDSVSYPNIYSGKAGNKVYSIIA